MHKLTQYIKEALSGYYPDSELRSIIKILYTEVLHLSMVDIYMGKDINLSVKQVSEIESIVCRLQEYEPLQYIIGTAEFYGLTLNVAPGVLIPRPETTELVECIVKENQNREVRILDIGTGSGCIALALNKQLPQATVTAWDVSDDALRIASLNNVKVNGKVRFEKVDVLTVQPEKEIYDIIVSNPPYIIDAEKKEMERNVLDWEPSLALFVPDNDPLRFYRKISELGREMLRSGGKVYFEINRAFGKETKVMMKELGYTSVEVIKDLSGNDRIIKAQK